MKTNTISLFILLLLLVSCNKEAAKEADSPQAEAKPATTIPKEEPIDTCIAHQVADCKTDRKKPNIRVRNVSKYDYCNFRLDVGWGFVNYGNIPAGDSSCYRSFDHAWSNQSLDFTITGHVFSRSVHDHLGEKMLSAGNYTIKINVFDFARNGVDSYLRAD